MFSSCCYLQLKHPSHACKTNIELRVDTRRDYLARSGLPLVDGWFFTIHEYPFILTNYIVDCEVSVPTIIVFSVIHKDVDNLHEWQTFRPQRPSSEPDFAFGPKAFIRAKSGSDEGLWAEASSICINYQHLCRLH